MNYQIKQSVLNKEIVALHYGQPATTPAKFDSLSKEGFNRNVWAYRCIMRIATSASNIPILLYQKKGKKLVEIENHPLLDLMSKPNVYESGSDFIEKAIAFLLLSGNSYIEMNGPTKNGAPTELWCWRPDRTTIVPGGDYIKSFRYNVNGKEIDLPFDRMLHTKFFSPLDDFYGLSPISVASRTLDMDNGTTDWNTSLVQNSASPSGFLKTQGNLSDTVFNRLKVKVRKMFSGKRNAGKAHILEGGIEWQQTGLSPKDMDFINSRKMTREEICAVFGVPPQLVGIQDKSTYSNYQEARGSFYTETVLPTLDKLLDCYNHMLTPFFGDSLKLSYDVDKIEALQENTDTKYERMKNVSDILTINERREELGFEAKPGGDVFLIPSNMYAVGKDSAMYQNATTSSNNKEKNNSKYMNNLASKDPFEYLEKALDSLEKKSEEDKYISDIESFREKYEKTAIEFIQKRFKEEKDRILAQYEKNGEKGLFEELKTQEKEWHTLISAIYYSIIEDVGNWNFNRLIDEYSKSHNDMEVKLIGKLFSITALIKKFIKETAVLAVTHISETTRTELKNVIDKGIANSESIQKIRKRIETVYEDFDARRSMTIARTEVFSATSYAAQEGARQTGFEMTKEWVTVLDGRERDSHSECNGQEKDLDEYYDIGDSKAMFPCDPDLPAKERIQCRCVEKHHVK